MRNKFKKFGKNTNWKQKEIQYNIVVPYTWNIDTIVESLNLCNAPRWESSACRGAVSKLYRCTKNLCFVTSFSTWYELIFTSKEYNIMYVRFVFNQLYRKLGGEVSPPVFNFLLVIIVFMMYNNNCWDILFIYLVNFFYFQSNSESFMPFGFFRKDCLKWFGTLCQF